MIDAAVAPDSRRIDVAIVGAGIAGSAIAWWLTRLSPGLSVTLIERDTLFSCASSQRSASSIRQQFTSPVNVRISQFGLDFLKTADELLAVDDVAPRINLVLPGYLTLAGADQAATLVSHHATQRAHGADVALLDAAALARRFAWLNTSDLALGVHGEGIEGWFDGPALHAALLASARAQGARLLEANVVAIETDAAQPRRVNTVRLADGTRLSCGWVVNAAGPWSRQLAAQVGIELPVHARRRTVFVLSSPAELDRCPLLIDPAGFWFRPEGRHLLWGRTPSTDADDLPLEPDLGEFAEADWVRLAHRVPALESLRVERAWAGYYEMNTFDHNALLGVHPGFDNLLCATGFSGHGMQQAPAVGRGIAELILHGRYRSLDLSDLDVARLHTGRRVLEGQVIG